MVAVSVRHDSKMADTQLDTYVQLADLSWIVSSTKTIEVRPAWAVLAAALASPPPAGQRGDIFGALAEAALLRNYLSIGQPGPLRWTSAYHSTPVHLQRFLTESAAIAITVELAGQYGWDPYDGHRLYWFDDLKSRAPGALQTMLPVKGPFPDVLCETPGGWVSVESRGRGTLPPKRPAPNAAQRARLQQLDEWAVSVARVRGGTLPSWAMGWAWFGSSSTRVDFYDPGDPVQLAPDDEAELEEYSIELDSRFSDVVDNSVGRYCLSVRGTEVQSAISTAGSPLEDTVQYAGVVVRAGGALVPNRNRQHGDFDVVRYRDSLYFAGQVSRSRAAELSEVVSDALEQELI